MDTFIGKIAQVINECGLPENEICVVFPNRRAGLFLKKELIPSDKPRWLPVILSIEDFVFESSRLIEPDNNQLLAILYKSYAKVVDQPVSFDNFLGFGAEILRDFEEADQYLANPKELFDYVSQARQIDIWKPGENQTEFERNYIKFYNSLSKQYYELKNQCLERRIAWQGLAARLIAENPSEYFSLLPWKKIIFAGFNALTPAQLSIIRFLIEEKKSELIFDADEYYLDDPLAEAGHFLRKYKNDKSLGSFKEISSNITNNSKNIFTCGIPGKSGQARIAGKLLSRIPPEEHHLTAVVLADESMLLPVLNSLPGHLGKFNVTMGFPLNQTPLYALVDSIFRLHVNASPQGSENPSYYHTDVTSVLSSAYLGKLPGFELTFTLISRIRKNNYSYISHKEICKLADEETNSILNLLFTACKTPIDLLYKIGLLLDSLKKEMVAKGSEASSEDRYLTEILFALFNQITGLIECIVREEIEIGTLQTLYNFFRETASSSRVPFYGEPLQGIQIMGMLETRVLDFKNVILLSANEDTLPSAKTNKSFIPFDIRVHYGLPTHHERQAIFAYHFYHLIQRCNNAWLVYNEDEDTFGGGEKSRYLSQLEWDLPKKGLVVRQLFISEPSGTIETKPIVIEKDALIIEKLKEKALKGFSFSSLRLYINCSLSFYYTYVLGLKEPDEVEEDISSRTMGTILHEVLEDIYSQCIGSFPPADLLKESIKDAEKLVTEKTTKMFPALRLSSGRNYLFIKVAETWLKRFLRDELNSASQNIQPVIKGIELPLERSILIELPGQQAINVKLYGKVDRLDAVGNVLRVIDYKTGKIDDKDVVIKNIDDLFSPEKSTDKQLQLLLYKYIAEASEISKGYQITPGILSFRSLGKGLMPLVSEIQTVEFEVKLKDLLQELFNTEISFSQTDEKHCKYCNFQQICHRN